MKRPEFWKGFHAAMGVVFALCLWGALTLVVERVFFTSAFDDTDGNGERSGMMPLIDHKTGCQYLSRGSDLTPRLDRDGKPMCGGEP